MIAGIGIVGRAFGCTAVREEGRPFFATTKG
jgi:hypothetical protein